MSLTALRSAELNLESRNFATLATLVPGAAPAGTGFDPTSTGVLANATISFNGVPGNFNNWEIDGTNNVDQGSGSNSLMLYPEHRFHQRVPHLHLELQRGVRKIRRRKYRGRHQIRHQ